MSYSDGAFAANCNDSMDYSIARLAVNYFHMRLSDGAELLRASDLSPVLSSFVVHQQGQRCY